MSGDSYMTITASIVGLIAGSIVITMISDTDWFRKIWTRTFSWKQRNNIKLWGNIAVIVTLTVLFGIGVYSDILNWGILVVPSLLGIPYLIGAVGALWKDRRDSGQNTIQNIVNNDMPICEIAQDALLSIGCKPEVNSDGSISVSYQGENFLMEFYGKYYARVWDPMWAVIKADDPDLPKVREAVNAANYIFGPTVVLTSPDEDGVIGFHSRTDILLHPANPDNVPFVKGVLDSFFDAKENVRAKYQQLEAQYNENVRKRRPIGFTISKNEKKGE